MTIHQDTRDWLTARAIRIIQGPPPRLMEGYEQVPEGTVEALREALEDGSDDDVDEGPVDEHELRAEAFNTAMAMNSQIQGVVEHVASLRRSFIERGFSEETAEEFCGSVWHSIIGALTE
jgi:hypothetical protein